MMLIMSLSVLDRLPSKSVSLRFEKASMNLPEVALSLYFMLSKFKLPELCNYSISKLIQKWQQSDQKSKCRHRLGLDANYYNKEV